MKFSVALTAVLAVTAAKPNEESSIRGKAIRKDFDKKETYIVAFKNQKRGLDQRCEALARDRGGSVVHQYHNVLNGCALRMPQAAFDALKNNNNIAWVEKDETVHISSTASWGIDRINQCSLPLNNVATKKDATGVKVYILDSGIHGKHDEFVGSINLGSTCHGDFTVSGDGFPLQDDHGHGTHVASIACGKTYGVSENCDLCSVKVLDAAGSGKWSDIIAGIDHVVGDCGGSRCVVNMSLGGRKSKNVNRAVDDAVNMGVVFVVAAGNSNDDACNYSPASSQAAITVGSTTSNDELSWFTNYGPCLDAYAPGSDITAAWNTGDNASNTISGTSMASPHVTGIAAAILSGGYATPSEVANTIKYAMTATDIDSRSPGIGIVTVGCECSYTATDSCPSPTGNNPPAEHPNAPTTDCPSYGKAKKCRQNGCNWIKGSCNPNS